MPRGFTEVVGNRIEIAGIICRFRFNLIIGQVKFIIDNFLFGQRSSELSDDASFLEALRDALSSADTLSSADAASRRLFRARQACARSQPLP